MFFLFLNYLWSVVAKQHRHFAPSSVIDPALADRALPLPYRNFFCHTMHCNMRPLRFGMLQKFCMPKLHAPDTAHVSSAGGGEHLAGLEGADSL